MSGLFWLGCSLLAIPAAEIVRCEWTAYVRRKAQPNLVGGCVVGLDLVQAPHGPAKPRTGVAGFIDKVFMRRRRLCSDIKLYAWVGAPGRPPVKVGLEPGVERMLWLRLRKFKHVKTAFANPMLAAELTAVHTLQPLSFWPEEQASRLAKRQLELMQVLRGDLKRHIQGANGAYHVAFECLAGTGDTPVATGLVPFNKQAGIPLPAARA